MKGSSAGGRVGVIATDKASTSELKEIRETLSASLCRLNRYSEEADEDKCSRLQASGTVEVRNAWRPRYISGEGVDRVGDALESAGDCRALDQHW